ncbi:hypothetical protein F4809DRAFT_639251 [Biscogniauxia mediterranea]|nr:hypothetical protein F4809DRAFT_639251 [Biscogniauxia mediterranea]
MPNLRPGAAPLLMTEVVGTGALCAGIAAENARDGFVKGRGDSRTTRRDRKLAALRMCTPYSDLRKWENVSNLRAATMKRCTHLQHEAMGSSGGFVCHSRWQSDEQATKPKTSMTSLSSQIVSYA